MHIALEGLESRIQQVSLASGWEFGLNAFQPGLLQGPWLAWFTPGTNKTAVWPWLQSFGSISQPLPLLLATISIDPHALARDTLLLSLLPSYSFMILGLCSRTNANYHVTAR